MSDLTLRKCNICLSEYIPLDLIVFFQCGHNACRSCSERSRLDPSCAECRKPKGVPHRIYLSSDDFVDQPAGRIIDDLNGINTEDPAESIAGAGERIRRFNDMVKGNRDVSRALLTAARDLEERVAPLAMLHDEVKKQNQELLSRLQHSESAGAVYKTETSRAKEIAEMHKNEERRLHERAQGYLGVIKQRNMEIARLKMELNERDKTENLMRTKLRALGKSQRHESRKMCHVGDTSLHVEPKSRPSS